MSKRDITLYIIDIFIAANKLTRYTIKFINSEEFLHSEIEWDATIRELQLIGDAINALLQEEILDSSYRRIVDFRNQIVHGYFGIDHDIVWDVIQNKIPKLIIDITDTIKKLNIDTTTAIESAIIENSYNKTITKYLLQLKAELTKS